MIYPGVSLSFRVKGIRYVHLVWRGERHVPRHRSRVISVECKCCKVPSPMALCHVGKDQTKQSGGISHMHPSKHPTPPHMPLSYQAEKTNTDNPERIHPAVSRHDPLWRLMFRSAGSDCVQHGCEISHGHEAERGRIGRIEESDTRLGNWQK
jgi:hypothetical protein